VLWSAKRHGESVPGWWWGGMVIAGYGQGAHW
jgi:hypothetical protein